MKHRIQLKTPDYSHQFEIENGSAKKLFTWWEFYPEWEQLEVLREFGEIACHPKFSEVLHIVGSHATLWLDKWEGVVAPMDVPPEGWQYPSGTPLEPEWWWLWYPKKHTMQAVLEYLNTGDLLQLDNQTPFKGGIPFQVQRAMGRVEQVEAIPVQRLPGLVRKDVEWIFEFEKEAV